jgi:hypothetical protein
MRRVIFPNDVTKVIAVEIELASMRATSAHCDGPAQVWATELSVF